MNGRPRGTHSPPPTLKRLGQHFLRDQNVLARITEAVAPAGEDTVVEIGPGRGALTELLLPRARRLIAIEVDRQLAQFLREKFRGVMHLEIVEADVLEVDLGAIAGERFVLAGNVPYYITTPIIFHALRRPRPLRAVYLVQREVAERIVSPPGSRAYGALSVNVQAIARTELLFGVPPGAFSPPPSVDSAVIRVQSLDHPVVCAEDEARFRSFTQEAFGLRRKQMRRVVRTIFNVRQDAADEMLRLANVDPLARPETLTASQFAAVLRASVLTAGERER